MKPFFALLNVASRDIFCQDSDEWAGRLIPYGGVFDGGVFGECQKAEMTQDSAVSVSGQSIAQPMVEWAVRVVGVGVCRPGIEGKKRGGTAK